LMETTQLTHMRSTATSTFMPLLKYERTHLRNRATDVGAE
jgi:hypothetical protein